MNDGWVFRSNPELNTAIIGLVVAIMLYATAVFKKKLESIKFQVHNNHGTSMKDSVDRTETLLKDVNETLKETRKDIGGLREEVRRLAKVDVNDREHTYAEFERIWNAIERIMK